MTRRYLALTAMAVSLWMAARRAGAAGPDIGRLSDAVRRATIDDALGTNADQRRAKVAEAEAIAGKLSPDGSWPDVDYANASRGAWPSAKHCERIVLLASAAEEAGAQRDPLDGAALRALGWWRARDPKCLNWWYNEIAIPRFLGGRRSSLATGCRGPIGTTSRRPSCPGPRSRR